MRWLVLAVVLLAPTVAAHAPGSTLPGDTLARATPVGLPARVLDAPEGGVDAHYLRLVLDEPQTLRVRVVAPEAREGLVILVAFGPARPNGTFVPPDIERPEGAGALTMTADGRAEGVEARLPARWTTLLSRDLEFAAGEHVLVLRTEGEGRVGLLIEPVAGSWTDVLVLPSFRGEVRAWTSQPAWLAPLCVVVGAAPAVLLARRVLRPGWTLLQACALALVAFVGASWVLLVGDSVVAGTLAAWPLLLAGAAVLAAATSAARGGRWARVALGAAAIVALASYHGFLWGPILGVAGALLPEPTRER